MTNVFDNLKELKNDMENKGWSIDSFLFHYKQVQYVVLVKLYHEKEKKPQYALVKMEFINAENCSITIPTNSRGFMTDIVSTTEIRNFFGVEYQENIGEFMQQFHTYLAGFIPKEVRENKTSREERCMVNSLSESDGEEADRIYCYKVRRNPVVNNRQQVRSIYNDNKTRLLRRTLYEEYETDDTISFCYTDDKTKEKTDIEIKTNFAKNVANN